MDAQDIENVQSSFSKVVPVADIAADLFYSRLFEIAPEVRPLFKGDMKAQGKKLMQMLGLVVTGLTDLPTIIPAAENLAVKHVGYGVKDEHYAIVGAVLIWTLEQGLADAFTDEIRLSWEKVYGALSSLMIEAASKA